MKRTNFLQVRLLLLTLLICIFGNITADNTPAFPGAEGYGRYTTGGRGGSVYHVTTLDDCSASNPVEGTLRYGCTKASNSTIVFDVSGTIHLTSALALTASNVTLAGQTAPGDGICVADYPFTISGTNVIVRYMRFRLGNKNVAYHEGDGLGGMDTRNVVVDHCSISWSIDECCSLYGIKNLTVQWCLIAQSLRESGHSKGAHGYGGNWGGEGASYHHNLMCHHESRVPRLGPRQTTQEKELLDMRNNVFYNWGGNGCYGGEGMNVNIVNNYYKGGPATKKKGGSVAYRIACIGIRTYSYCISSINGKDTTWNGWKPMLHKWGKLYVDGNVIEGNSEVTNDNWTKGIYAQTSNGSGNDYTWTQTTKDTIRLNSALGFTLTTTHSAQDAYSKVLDYAGASLKRDSFDEQMVYDTRNGVATYGNSNNYPGFVDSQDDNKPADASASWSAWPTLNSTAAKTDSDKDGMPDEWETANGLNPYDSSDRNNVNSEGYTMLEIYINSIIDSITESQNQGGTLSGESEENSTSSSNFALVYGGWTPSTSFLSVESTGNMNAKGNSDAANAIIGFDIKDVVGAAESVSLGEYFDLSAANPCKFENSTYTISAQGGYAISAIHSIGYTSGEAKPTFGSIIRQINNEWEATQTVEIPTVTNPNIAEATTTAPALSSVNLSSDKGDVTAIKITRGGRENACMYILELYNPNQSGINNTTASKLNISIAGDYIFADNASVIEIYSISGNKVISAAASLLDISDLAKGIYVVRAANAKGELSDAVKFIR